MEEIISFEKLEWEQILCSCRLMLTAMTVLLQSDCLELLADAGASCEYDDPCWPGCGTSPTRDCCDDVSINSARDREISIIKVHHPHYSSTAFLATAYSFQHKALFLAYGG
jgi:hypothetical protein